MKLLFACLLIAACMYATYAGCADKDDCYECLRAVANNEEYLCGWCAETLTCEAGTVDGPGGFSSNCTNEWYWDTCSGDDCAEFDNDCDGCIDNPLCGYCHTDNSCIELQGSGECSGTDTFSTYDCAVLGQRCGAGEVDDGEGSCVDCPPYGSEDNQASNACNFVGYCEVDSEGTFCRCKSGYNGASCQYITKQADNDGTLTTTNVADGATNELNPGTAVGEFVGSVSITNNSGGAVDCFLLGLEVDEDGNVVNENQYSAASEAAEELSGEIFPGFSGFDFSCLGNKNREVDIDSLNVQVTIDAGAQGLTCSDIVLGKYDTDSNTWTSINEECGEPSGTTSCVFNICHFSQFNVLQNEDSTTTVDSTTFSVSTTSSSTTTSAAAAVQPAVALAFAALVGAFFF